MTDYYAIEILKPSYDIEVMEMVNWCVDNDVEFFTQSVKGMKILDRVFKKDDILEAEGVLDFEDGNKVTLENVEEYRFKVVGTVFLFNTEKDVTAFKLRWVE
jgi:hypothetical protein